MKRPNRFVMLFAIIGLSSGFLLIQDAKRPQLAETDPLPSARAARAIANVKVAPGSSRAERIFREDPPSEGGSGSQFALVSSRGSVKPVSVAAIPAVGQEQTFRILGLKTKASNVRVAVFQSEAGFPNSELSSTTAVFSTTKDQVSFSLELPRNQLVAIAVFQDIDGNGKLSKNKFGVPTEPYGFSNNVRGLFGPPAFSQAAFTLGDDSENLQPIEITVR